MQAIQRRDFLRACAAGTTLALAGCAATRRSSSPLARVVVIGGGFGGATAARYIRRWAPEIEVVLIERNPDFISCPLSNLVLGGSRDIASLTVSYDTLVSRHGVRLVRDSAIAVDADKREVRLQSGDPHWRRGVTAPIA